MPTTNGVIENAINPQNVQQTTHAPNANARSLSSVRPDLSYQATTSQVDPTTETVEGRVESLLSKDNALMQRARAISAGQMAGRGLVNSSMGLQAGTAAMMDRAIPIASQDAQTYSQRAMFNTDAVNQGGMFNAGEANRLAATHAQLQTEQSIASQNLAAQRAMAEAQRSFQEQQNALDREQQARILEMQQAFQGSESALDRENQRWLTEFQVGANQANIPKAQVAEITLRLQDSIAQIAASPDMKPDAKAAQIKNAYDAANASIQTISTLYNTPLAGVGNVGTIRPGAQA